MAADDAAAAPTVAAPPTAEEGEGDALMSLNVRTLDQRTFPVRVGSGASVPQLKEAVAVETGVTLARQRLIFRGRVLKNDQKLSAYSLEDGHTLHLVVRADPAAAPAPEAAASAASTRSNEAPNARTGGGNSRGTMRTRSSTGSRSARVLRAMSRDVRDNDEPDPALNGGPQGNRVLMGATITVPEGADVNMPFLSSMIANIMTSVHDSVSAGGGGGGADPATGVRHVTWSEERPGRHRSRLASRSRRERGDAARGTGQAAGTGALHQTADGLLNADRQASLRSRTAERLDNIQETLNNAEFDFPGIEHAAVDPAANSDAAAFQAQLDQFATLMGQFGARMQLLPVALSDRDRLQDQTLESQFPLTRPIVRAIETLQTIGESADLLSRTARHLFLRQSSRTVGEFNRFDEIRRHRAAQSAARALRVPMDGSAEAAAPPAPGQGAEGNADARVPTAFPPFRRSRAAQYAARAVRVSVGGSSEAAASPTPGQGADGSADASAPATTGERTEDPQQQEQPQQEQPQQQPGHGVFPPFLERLLAGSRSFPVDLTGANRPAGASGAVARPDRALGPNRISIGGLGLPLASVMFPISLSGANSGATTWNFAEFLSRLVDEIPSSTLYGLLTGDPNSVHQIMAHVGFALLSGVDVPQVTRAGIRTWSSSFVDELRRQLQAHGIPSAVLAEVESSRRSGFTDELVHPIEPFVPELVDFFFRATSASRTAAFGARSAEFLRTMSLQFVTRLSAALGNDSERLARVLRQLLAYLGMQENLAAFAVDSFIQWTGYRDEAAASSSASGRRQRSTTSESSASEPSIKRQRRP